jgi:hypothetical protein
MPDTVVDILNGVHDKQQTEASEHDDDAIKTPVTGEKPVGHQSQSMETENGL